MVTADDWEHLLFPLYLLHVLMLGILLVLYLVLVVEFKCRSFKH